jgi:type VI secretion system protein ImpF
VADRDHEAGITLSIVDRLTDLEPDSKVEGRSSSWEDMREIKAALCRDLAALFNTRRAEQDFDPAYEQATNSLLTFGVADFTSFNLKNGIEQERVRRSIEQAIRQFEPRLARVTVSLDQPDHHRPMLRFQIDAMLRIGPNSEAVLFDATLYRDSRRIDVSGANS